MLAAPLSAARDARGGAARDAARSKAQRDALDHAWDAALCGSLARLKAALKAEAARRARTTPGFRPPWAPVSAHDRTPRLGRTALHLVALGAARAKAHAHRARRGAKSAAVDAGRFAAAHKAPAGAA